MSPVCHCPTTRCSCQHSRAAPRNSLSMRWVLPVPRPLRGAVGCFPRCCVGQKLLLQLFGALAKAHPARRASEDRGGTTFSCPARCLWEQDSQPCRLSSCLVQVNLFDTRCKCTEQLVWLALTPQPSDPLHRKPLWLGWKGLKAHEGKTHLCSKSRHPLLSFAERIQWEGKVEDHSLSNNLMIIQRPSQNFLPG